MHPLDGAYERVSRAGVHLADLGIQIGILNKRVEDSIVVYHNQKASYKAGDTLGAFSVSLPNKVPIVQILVGETVYNLRSALDYLVYELARFDSGSIQHKTQFSIEDSKDVFWGRHRGNLKGLNDKHVAAIELLQPYNGCSWTKLIRNLSDPDKHRELTISKAATNIVVNMKIGVTTDASESPMNMKDSATVHIAFSAGSSIVDVDILNELKAQVTETLHLFKPEFQ